MIFMTKSDCIVLERIFNTAIKDAGSSTYKNGQIVLVDPNDIELGWSVSEKRLLRQENCFDIVQEWPAFYQDLLDMQADSEETVSLPVWSLSLEENRVLRSMLEHPITFAKLENGKIHIIDGNHRVLSAQKNSVAIPIMCSTKDKTPWALRNKLTDKEKNVSRSQCIISLVAENEEDAVDIGFDY